MKKLSILFLVLCSTSLFAKNSEEPAPKRKPTVAKINGQSISYYKNNKLTQRFLFENFKELKDLISDNYKQKGNSFRALNKKNILMKLYIRDEKFFEYNTRLSKKWATRIISKSEKLFTLSVKIFELNSQDKLDTEAGKKVLADYKTIAKEIFASIKKPVKANKKIYDAQKKAYAKAKKRQEAIAKRKAAAEKNKRKKTGTGSSSTDKNKTKKNDNK
ncbi:hypothetical protein AAEX28_13495 [Lentisphaerota bacterium WC36G]|nr:hypothetical protein LJT99_00250 [Lentisphaerae bacterium WC36]